MSRCWPAQCVLALVVAASMAGCGESAPPPGDIHQGEEAQRIVLEFTAKAKRAPAAAPGDLTVLMETLDAYVENASGEHEPTYIKIRDTAKELQGLYGRKAPPAEINAKLDQMSQLAQSLLAGAAAGS